MCEGYVVHESFFYASEYLSQIDLSSPKMWNANKYNEKLEGEVIEIGKTPYYIKGMNYILDLYMHFEFTKYINA